MPSLRRGNEAGRDSKRLRDFLGKKERSLFWYRGKLKDEISILGSMFSDDGLSKLADICQNCQVVLVYYGKKWDDERWGR